MLQLKARLVSYGSFVWVQAILGDGWPQQRLFNIGRHIAAALALYALVLVLLEHTTWRDEQQAQPQFASSLRGSAEGELRQGLTLRRGVAVNALRPLGVQKI